MNRRGLELLSPAQLGIVCFRRVGEPENDRDEAAIEELNRAIVTRIAASGAGMISSTRVRGRYALRLCIMNHRTGWDDVETVLSAAAAP